MIYTFLSPDGLISFFSLFAALDWSTFARVYDVFVSSKNVKGLPRVTPNRTTITRRCAKFERYNRIWRKSASVIKRDQYIRLTFKRGNHHEMLSHKCSPEIIDKRLYLRNFTYKYRIIYFYGGNMRAKLVKFHWVSRWWNVKNYFILNEYSYMQSVIHVSCCIFVHVAIYLPR